MSAAPLPVQFENTAGQVLAHPDGYGILRYRAGKRQPGDLAGLLTQLGQLLLRHGWYRFLADNRQMGPLNEAEKTWFIEHWLGGTVARPQPLWGVVVLPTEVVARLSISQMLSAGGPDSIQYKTFMEMAPAEAYLRRLSVPVR